MRRRPRLPLLPRFTLGNVAVQAASRRLSTVCTPQSEFCMADYLIFYREHDGAIRIERVMHGARDIGGDDFDVEG